MRFLPLCTSTLLFLTTAVWADEQVRRVQTELKQQGFYYGDVNGASSAETTAALRRYQIRYGLEVTGTLTPETLRALSSSGQPASTRPAAPPARAQNPPPPLRSNSAPALPPRPSSPEVHFSEPPAAQREYPSAAEVPTRPFYRTPGESSIVPPPTPLDAPNADYPVLFAGTPYANAPRVVQQQTLRRAQAALSSLGFYTDIVDGLPGPSTEEAVLTFQRNQRLALSGRFDLGTLARLRLLPGNRATGVDRGSPPASTHLENRVYRGIWVN